GLDIVRKQVKAGRPRTDLIRLEALLEQEKISLARSRVSLEAAWRQLAAEIGIPDLPLPEDSGDWTEPGPDWDEDVVVGRVLSAHSDIRQPEAEAERARLAVERARAEAVPNVTVGGGWDRDSVEGVSGAVLNVETALPVWDRRQGRIYEARAQLARARAARQAAVNRLARDTAEAFGRYRAARQPVLRLRAEVLPRLEEGLQLVRKAYEAGAPGTTFADVLLAQQSLNEARVLVAKSRRDLWHAVADLEGLMQRDVDQTACGVAAALTK